MRLQSCLLVMLLCGLASGALAQYDYQLEKGMSSALRQQYKRVCGDPMSYYKKNLKVDTNEYKTDSKDFNAVMEECRNIGKNEKRFFNFIIRTTFHDALAVDPKKVAGSGGGADGSIFTQEELTRGENQGFATDILRAIVTIADQYDVSIADTLAVCGAVAAEELAGNRFKIIGADGTANFPVGRLDSTQPNPENQFLSPRANAEEFVQWWTERGFTVDEAVALLGSHALLKPLGCSRSSRPGDVCDPVREDCSSQVRMFKWNTHYYEDACTGGIDILANPVPARRASNQDFAEIARTAMCQFTSEGSRNAKLQEIQDQMRAGTLNTSRVSVRWNQDNCEASKQLGINNCPHTEFWPYTMNDAHLGRACQGLVDSPAGRDVKKAMIEYLDQDQWDKDFTTAYIKMMTRFANFGQKFNIGGSDIKPAPKDQDQPQKDAPEYKPEQDTPEYMPEDNNDGKYTPQEDDQTQYQRPQQYNRQYNRKWEDDSDDNNEYWGKRHYKRRGDRRQKSKSWGRYNSW